VSALSSNYLCLMKNIQSSLAACSALTVLCFTQTPSLGADVKGYSVLKGQFFIQTGPEDLVLDSDFGFSVLASVDATDFDLITEASFRTGDGTSKPMDNLGDSWSFLDTFETSAELDAAYPWGAYGLDFTTVNDGTFACDLNFPETPLPPLPRLVNFSDVQAVDPTKPLTLTWDFAEPPKPDDFVEVYITLGHAVVVTTPGSGEPGAFDTTDRDVIIPPFSLAPGLTYSLNIEITRVASTNATCYPSGQGAAGTLSSTSTDLTTLFLPTLRLLSGPTNGVISVEVLSEPNSTVVLQNSSDLAKWSNIATNAATSGTNVFSVTLTDQLSGFYRATKP